MAAYLPAELTAVRPYSVLFVVAAIPWLYGGARDFTKRASGS